MNEKRWIQLGMASALAAVLCFAVPAAQSQEGGKRPAAANGQTAKEVATSAAEKPTASEAPDPKLAAPGIPAGLDDRSMERFVDVAMLSEAWAELDARLLTDAALQMKHAEDVLLRTHATLRSQDLMEMAARVAFETSDEASLARLRKAAELHGNRKVAAYIEEMASDAAEHPVSEPTISLAELTPDLLTHYQQLQKAIRFAKVSRDSEALEHYLNDAEAFASQNKALAAHLQEIAARGRRYVATTPDNPGAEVVNSLNHLAAFSNGKAPPSPSGGAQSGSPPKVRMVPGTGSDLPPGAHGYVPGTGSDYPPGSQPYIPGTGSYYPQQPPYKLVPGTDSDYPSTRMWSLGIRTGGFHWRWGVSVREVVPGSAAERIGLEYGDWILSANGRQIQNAYDYHRLITYSSGYVRLAIWDQRTGRTVFRSVQLDPYYYQPPVSQPWNQPQLDGYGAPQL